MQFGINFNDLTGQVYIGRLNKKGDMFLEKQEAIKETLVTVMKLIKFNDENNQYTALVDDEFEYIFTVTKRKKERK